MKASCLRKQSAIKSTKRFYVVQDRGQLWALWPVCSYTAPIHSKLLCTVLTGCQWWSAKQFLLCWPPGGFNVVAHCCIQMIHTVKMTVHGCISTLFYCFTEMGEHLIKHGDGVKDIAFQVEDCDFLIKVTMTQIYCNSDVLRSLVRVCTELATHPQEVWPVCCLFHRNLIWISHLINALSSISSSSVISSGPIFTYNSFIMYLLVTFVVIINMNYSFQSEK